MDSDHVIDQLAELFGLASAQDVDIFLEALAHSGLDLSSMSLEDLQDLFEQAIGPDNVPDATGAPLSRPDAHSEIPFAGGRWEGSDQWGNRVEQSSLGPPTNANNGAQVDPNDVTWNK